MLIRLTNKLVEVDKVVYTTSFKPGRHVTNVCFTGESRIDIMDDVRKKYMNIIYTKDTEPTIDPVTHKSTIGRIFDADEKVTIYGLSFNKDRGPNHISDELYFLECSEDVADELLTKLAADRYLDLRNI